MISNEKMGIGAKVQHRMLQPGKLLTLDGRLMEAGYATQAIKQYERAQVRAPAWRIKEWDYYLIANNYYALALTVSDNGYLGLDSVSLMDFEEKSAHTATRLSPFPMGKHKMPENSGAGMVRGQGKQYEISFRAEGRRRHLYGHVYDFGGKGKPLLFDVIVNDMPGDSMVLAKPFPGRPHHFYYNRKTAAMPAEGRVICGDKDIRFSPAGAFGVLDWGRGVWPYSSTWYWASASGVVDGRRFALNLGYGFGDEQAATENMLFFDGNAQKLGAVSFDIPMKNRRENYLSSWEINDDAGRLALRFEPILDRAARVSALVLASDQHQVFGRFYGKVVSDEGRPHELKGLIGFAEKVRNRF